MNGQSKKTQGNIDEVTVDTTIELLWPPSGLWQTGTITHAWGNGEFAIRFEDDRMSTNSLILYLSHFSLELTGNVAIFYFWKSHCILTGNVVIF